MENIFENAKFGDKFLTKDGRIAVLIKIVECPKPYSTHYHLIVEGQDVGCGICVYANGKEVGYAEELNTNIVTPYIEPIDAYELDKLANECYYEMSDVADVVCADVKEAFRRGYEKAKSKRV